MDYLSLFVCYVCAVSVSELLVTPNNLKSVLPPSSGRIIKNTGSTKQFNKTNQISILLVIRSLYRDSVVGTFGAVEILFSSHQRINNKSHRRRTIPNPT
jgi:hypothetical protein